MKTKLGILVMLVLLVMIASPVTSQVRYIIDEQEYTCYNSDENREIAKIFVEGEYCEAMLELANKELDEIRYRNNRLKEINNYNTEAIIDLNKSIDECLLIAREYQNAYVDANNRANTNARWLRVSLITNVVLTTLIIIL